jgi:membrane protein DedA with SNARE-associated domain/rhodanese-related sulfurtransferase
MDSTWIAQLLQQNNGNLLVFVNVFLQQLGVPVPSVPTMVLAGSKSSGLMALTSMLMVAVLASLMADWVWYAAGRKFGYRVLTLLCKMSINPSSCVNQTEARFMKWGVWSLVFGKFIPGFATVAPPVAGALGMPRSSFFLASAMGAGLWAGLALLAGYAFQSQIDGALGWMNAHGIHLALIAVALVAAVISWKYWQKTRFERMSAMQHIEMVDLQQALSGLRPPHIIDLRSPSLAAETGHIPNAHLTGYDAIAHSLSGVEKDYPIVTICACPQDAGAVQVAQSLQKLGYRNAYPLRGGFDAWKATQNTVAAHSNRL